jgi:Glycosyl transferases group 1
VTNKTDLVSSGLSDLGLSPEESKRISSILVFSGFSREEIANPKFGGAKLIAEQIAFFHERGLDTHLFVLEELYSPTGLLMRLAGWVRRRRIADIEFLPIRTKNDERNIWRVNLLLNLVLEAVAWADLLAQYHVAHVLGIGQDVLVIWNYSFGIYTLARIRSQAQYERARIFIYEHNVEEEFYRERIGPGLASSFLIKLLRLVELDNLSFADRVLCGSARDKETLETAGIEPEKIVVWIPKPYTSTLDRRDSKLPSYLQEELEGRYVVGFIGSDYGPNLTAVEHIIAMAGSLKDSVTFLVIGSVCNCFRGTEDMSENVVFCGFVEDLKAYLRICDAFINLKTTSDTGIEIKMLDYLGENKSVFSTPIGARGFEDYPGLIIAEIEEMPKTIQKEVDQKH